MNIQALSTSSIIDQHAGIRRALAHDLRVGPNPNWYYEVREWSTWARWRDLHEIELRRRGVTFEPVSWS